MPLVDGPMIMAMGLMIRPVRLRTSKVALIIIASPLLYLSMIFVVFARPFALGIGLNGGRTE
ncbi:MAG: hypothetical protein KDJ38_07300 [Gammaproteobacteria bacterium]|nr:hypothetical protein [Gammaproteobacteria bacterium]